MRTIDVKTTAICTEIDPADFLLTNNATLSFPGDTRRWIKGGPFNLGNPHAVTAAECSRWGVGGRGKCRE